jgi:hypothetical protein
VSGKWPVPPTPDTVSWRLEQLERRAAALEEKVDRLIWALTLAALSFAGASALLVLNVVLRAY